MQKYFKDQVAIYMPMSIRLVKSYTTVNKLYVLNTLCNMWT